MLVSTFGTTRDGAIAVDRESAAHKFGGDPFCEYLYSFVQWEDWTGDEDYGDGVGIVGRHVILWTSAGFRGRESFPTAHDAADVFAAYAAAYDCGWDGE